METRSRSMLKEDTRVLANLVAWTKWEGQNGIKLGERRERKGWKADTSRQLRGVCVFGSEVWRPSSDRSSLHMHMHAL